MAPFLCLLIKFSKYIKQHGEKTMLSDEQLQEVNAEFERRTKSLMYNDERQALYDELYSEALAQEIQDALIALGVRMEVCVDELVDWNMRTFTEQAHRAQLCS